MYTVNGHIMVVKHRRFEDVSCAIGLTLSLDYTWATWSKDFTETLWKGMVCWPLLTQLDPQALNFASLWLCLTGPAAFSDTLLLDTRRWYLPAKKCRPYPMVRVTMCFNGDLPPIFRRVIMLAWLNTWSPCLLNETPCLTDLTWCHIGVTQYAKQPLPEGCRVPSVRIVYSFCRVIALGDLCFRSFAMVVKSSEYVSKSRPLQ